MTVRLTLGISDLNACSVGFFAKHFGWFKHRFGSQPIATDPVAPVHPEPTRITLPASSLDPIEFASSDAPSDPVQVFNNNSTEDIEDDEENSRVKRSVKLHVLHEASTKSPEVTVIKSRVIVEGPVHAAFVIPKKAPKSDEEKNKEHHEIKKNSHSKEH
ncbi:hypothetical protein QR680_016150 [Steinernema hermaphroditum]|uniref:Uncharacterized protein n=1 Tax=Steinernema hermaphroditum TaxID=289476 RepID=A0AA39HA79_9BILA|nr:hypothetical protein QR680_016150 [Steinernema hermaphroditum]